MKVLAFGDSFVKMFIHCQPQVKHWKFKGKSVKGLVKEEDLDRRKIERQVRKTPGGTKILMFFGQVDFNYVRYYKIIKGEPPITEDTFKKYVEWVSSMNARKNISIVSIFPSPIKKANIISSLINKGSYLLEQQTQQIDEKILAQYEKSPQTWTRWNQWLAAYCQKYHVNNIKLFKENHLEPEFYDISGLTIHLRYVPVLKLVKNYIDITFDAAKAEEIEKQYEKEKVDRISNSIFRISSKDEVLVENVAKSQEKQPSVTNQLERSQSRDEVFSKCQTTETKLSECEELERGSSQEQQVVIKNVRKRTADLDTDTHIQKQTQKSHEVQSQQQQQPKKKQKKGTKKSKSTKQKQKPKQKKKYVCVQKSESEDEGQIFLQLAAKGKKKY